MFVRGVRSMLDLLVLVYVCLNAVCCSVIHCVVL